MKVLTVTLLLPLVLGLTIQEDDIVFEDVAEEVSSVAPVVHRKEHDTSRLRTETKKHRVERFLGVPDATVTVGHAFKLRIPKQAFTGNVDHYEISSSNGKPLPHWIYWDDPALTFLGVPTKKDIGQHRVTLRAYGKHGDVAIDSFNVHVKREKFDKPKHKDGKTHCKDGAEKTLLTIALDAKFDGLKPATKIEAIENLEGFLNLPKSSVSMHPQNGNTKHRKDKDSTSIQWQIGCDGHVWKHQTDLLKLLREQARDGTLAEVLQIPVISWRVKSDASALLRNRREIGSGDYGNTDDNEEYDENDYDEYEESYDDPEREDGDDGDSITELPPRAVAPNVSASKNVDQEQPEHPHRHHHGEETIGIKAYEDIDEEDIVPIVYSRTDNRLNGSFTTAASMPTTTLQTSTSSVTPSISSTTTTTSSPLSTTVETSLPTTITQSISSSTTSQVFKTTSDMTISVPSTTSTSTATTYGSVTIPPTMETTDSEITEDIAERTNLIETEFDTPSPASFPTENLTTPPTSPSSSTTLQTPTTSAATIATSSERTDSKSTSTVYVNVTEEEPTEKMELPTTMSQSTPTIIPSITPTTTTTTQVPTPVTTTTTMMTTTTTPVPETTPVVATTMPQPTTTTTTTTTTTPQPTTTTATTSTEPPRTIPPILTTEKIEYGVRNFPPRQDRRLKKIPVTAGKPLSYIIPADTFSDVEDGDTRKLKLSLYLQGSPVKATHWLQLNSVTHEVYGLPLESDVSKWDHDLVASDSEGLNVTERLDIYVQQHKLSRSINHEFSIYLKIDKRSAFPTNVDWEMKVVRSLAELYGDSDTSQITVRSIDITQDQAIFTWTNDSVPRSSECPKNDINRLLHVLIADKDQEPSAMLRKALEPEIRVKRVVYQGIGQCEAMTRPEMPKVSTEGPNKRPIPRNQVDHINATVGQLVIYRVPDDAFYDPEEGPTSKLKITLLAKDRSPIPARNWLQFDTKNQEFYGVPLREDIGRTEYQLVATDKEGLSATDGMIVTVEPALPMRHNVEFSMTLAIPYESFAHSATQKKTFIEKIRDLFHDKDTSAISLDSITQGSTVVTWRNTTLPTDHCPNDEIVKLSEFLVKPSKSLTERIEKVMGEEFPVEQITLTPMGLCLGQLTGVYSPDSVPPASGDSTPVGTSNDDYLITFVLPAIIIAAMLILAGIIACVLYRRRRSGKMSVSEQDDERQSFRSKGIPVIFQDELDEKPDPGNKSPVILKEEKPPLPPPEYQKAEDGADVPMLSNETSEEPYQPPPPFATNRDNNRQNRPKPTPTYRKPPPYVPP